MYCLYYTLVNIMPTKSGSRRSQIMGEMQWSHHYPWLCWLYNKPGNIVYIILNDILFTYELINIVVFRLTVICTQKIPHIPISPVQEIPGHPFIFPSLVVIVLVAAPLAPWQLVTLIQGKLNPMFIAPRGAVSILIEKHLNRLYLKCSIGMSVTVWFSLLGPSELGSLGGDNALPCPPPGGTPLWVSYYSCRLPFGRTLVSHVFHLIKSHCATMEYTLNI